MDNRLNNESNNKGANKSNSNINLVYIVGIGRSGLGILDFIIERQQHTVIIVLDADIAKIEQCKKDYASFIESGRILLKQLDGSKEFCNQLVSKLRPSIAYLSPGVPAQPKNRHAIVTVLEENNIKILSDMDLFYCASENSKHVGITGTNGKSTVVKWLYHVIAGCISEGNRGHIQNVYLGGNIGNSVLKLDIINNPNTLYILEISSYQLDISSQLRLDIGVILNIEPDHLDRYKDMNLYRASKEKILTLIKEEGEGIRFEPEKYNYAEIEGLVPASMLCKHNVDNANAVMLIATKLGYSKDDIAKHMKTFPGLDHRMEYVCSYNGLKCINDSKATNVAAAIAALKNFTSVYWIVGGLSKGEDLAELKEHMHRIVKAYVVGVEYDEIVELLDESDVRYEVCGELEVALQAIKTDVHSCRAIHAEGFVNPNACILLSPAFSSLDQWEDFNERGEFFKKILSSWHK